jgi:hypothetical protein
MCLCNFVPASRRKNQTEVFPQKARVFLAFPIFAIITLREQIDKTSALPPPDRQ